MKINIFHPEIQKMTISLKLEIIGPLSTISQPPQGKIQSAGPPIHSLSDPYGCYSAEGFKSCLGKL